MRGRGSDGTPVTVWVLLKNDDDGNPIPALRIDGLKEEEVTLDPIDSAQLITNLRDAWDAIGEIKSSREAPMSKGRGKRGPR